MATNSDLADDYIVSPVPVWKQLLSVWKTWVIILAPIICLPVALTYDDPVSILSLVSKRGNKPHTGSMSRNGNT